MLRQSHSKNCRSKKQFRPRHSFQAFLLFAVGIWIVYQLTRSYGKRRAVMVVTDDGGEAAARRRLGRKGFVGFAGHASSGIVEVDAGGQGAASSDDDPLSKAEDREGDGDGDGDDEDQEADEDDGADDANDGLAGDQEDDDGDLLLPLNGDSEDETKTLLGESDQATPFGDTRLHEPKELNRSAVPREVKAPARVQDAVASQQKNVTDGAANGRASATPLSGSPTKNASSVNLSFHDRGTAGDAASAEKLFPNGFVVREENGKLAVPVQDNRMTNQETADSVAGQGISSPGNLDSSS